MSCTPFRSKRVSLPASGTDLERQTTHRGFLIRFLPLDVTAGTTQRFPYTDPPTGCNGPWDARFIFCIPSHSIASRPGPAYRILHSNSSSNSNSGVSCLVLSRLVLSNVPTCLSGIRYVRTVWTGLDRTRRALSIVTLPREHKQASLSSFIAVEALKARAEVLNALSFLFRLIELLIVPFHRPFF